MIGGMGGLLTVDGGQVSVVESLGAVWKGVSGQCEGVHGEAFAGLWQVGGLAGRGSMRTRFSGS